MAYWNGVTIESQLWYYSHEGAQYGPALAGELALLIQTGEIPPTVPVCLKDKGDWLPAREHACFQVEIFPSMKKTGLQVNSKFEGRWKIHRVDRASAVLGRPCGLPVDVNLSPDCAVSRQHLKAWAVNNKVWVRDLNSRWGTFVNGEKIEAPTALGAKDVVTIGETQITLERFPLVAGPTANGRRLPSVRMHATQVTPPNYLFRA